MNNYGYIYKTTNLVNHKIYIGQKKGEFNGKYYGSGNYIKNALKHYDADNFKIEIITYVGSKEELDKLEKFYIAQYREDYSRGNLYNITDGGEGHNGEFTKEHKQNIRESRIGTHHREITKSRIGLRHKGKIISDKTKLLLKDAFMGEKNPCYGKKWIHNLFLNEIKLISKEELEKYLHNGWQTGLNRKGKNNPMYGKGYLVMGDKNPMYGVKRDKNPLYGKSLSEDHKNKLKGSHNLPREIRECICGCGYEKEVIITSKWKSKRGHYIRTKLKNSQVGV